MSSLSSTSALTRSRSLKQPTVGLNTNNTNNTNNANNNHNGGSATNKGATASIPADRNTSPSRLPKPGLSTITTRKRAGTTGSGIGDPPTTVNPPAAGTKGRSTSGILGRLNSVAARKPVIQGTAKDQAEPSKATTRLSAIKTTRLTRPASKSISAPSKLSPAPFKPSPPASETIPPNAAAPTTTQPSQTKVHVRAKSSATALTTATVLRPPRPPSAGSMASASATAATTTTTTAATSKRPPARSNTVTTRSASQRQVSGSITANKSALGRSSTTTARPTTRPTATATATDDAPRLRPAFSTLQQHYSPARNLAPKPLTSTFLAPPTPSRLPANVAISSETARLQAELLQLHLLHRDADAAAAAWHVSARERLGNRFAELAGADAGVGRDEAEAEEARNLAALGAWGGGAGLEDKIQVLDAIVSGVWSLGEPGGRYARVVRKFEKWVDRMVRTVEARRKAGGLGALMGDDTVAFVDELDPAWKEEVSSVTRKLDLWHRQLGQLGVGLPDGGDDEGQQPSSLARILTGCRDQVDDMLAELDIMGQIERDALAQETAWIRRMNRDDDEDDTPRAGAIWRAF